MKSGKPIDVSKSSLVSLKAELLKKQEEALQSKGSTSYVRPQPKVKKKLKKNKGVDERSQRDELTEEEVDALQKSRQVLEIKSQLYDKLQKGELVSEDPDSSYLVDFKEKAQSSSSDPVRHESASDHEEKEEEESDDDSEWTDYTDCLGRSRRCLKTDLSYIKEQDAALAATLSHTKPSEVTKPVKMPPPELVSADMQREAMRLKWEEQEKELANKKDIFYEDIRFDEARTHGVGYFALSTDAEKREEQLEAMRREREQTEAKQREAASARARRDTAKQARLVAARQRQRARLGLPPIDVSKIEEEMEKESAEPKEEEEKEEKVSGEVTESLEAQLKRAAHVRPWDIGKDGVPTPVMSQEEWVEKQRAERPEEFAPPSEYGKKEKKKKKKKKRRRSDSDEEESMIGPLPPSMDEPSPGPSWATPDLSKPPPSVRPKPFPRSVPKPEESKPQDVVQETRRGAEIPPPISFTFHTPQVHRRQLRPQAPNMLSSIEAGLQLLRKQADDRQKTLEKQDDEELLP